MTTLRESWPTEGLMIAPESPVGLTPATTRNHITRDLAPGDTWFSEEGNTVYYWTGSTAVILIEHKEAP
jgi:hypothetical protein